MTTPSSVGAEPLILTTYKESSVNVDDSLVENQRLCSGPMNEGIRI
jgi:hypothetical protein